MFKTFIKVLLALAFIIIVAYFLQARANTPEACANIDGLWDPVAYICKTPTDKVIFQSLSKPHPVSISLPDKQHLVVLNKAEQIEDYIYLSGHYDQQLVAAARDKKAVSDRASVHLNMSKLKLLTSNTSEITYFAAPFIVNRIGSGIFVYIGLFSYDFTTHQAMHLNSVLLGNHISEENIVVEGISIVKDGRGAQDGFIRVNFKKHGPKQALSEYPTQASHLLLQLISLDPATDKAATFNVVQKDNSNLGLNNGDCEQEGSCDHNIDAFQAKPE